jgi:hypothetical protein
MYENRIMKPVKIVFKKEGGMMSNIGSEFGQSTLYACMEISQRKICTINIDKIKNKLNSAPRKVMTRKTVSLCSN